MAATREGVGELHEDLASCWAEDELDNAVGLRQRGYDGRGVRKYIKPVDAIKVEAVRLTDVERLVAAEDGGGRQAVYVNLRRARRHRT
eukprot:scaffold40574_cov27-Tisochrysis_lutea.AAC.13